MLQLREYFGVYLTFVLKNSDNFGLNHHKKITKDDFVKQIQFMLNELNAEHFVSPVWNCLMLLSLLLSKFCFKHFNFENQVTNFQYTGFIVEVEAKQFPKIHAHFSCANNLILQNPDKILLTWF